MASLEKPDNCTSEPLDWALFAITIISQFVTWWLLPLPVIFRLGFRHYIHDVAWECMRLQQPTYILLRSCDEQERAHWQVAYYSGILKAPTRLDNIKTFVKDSLIVVSSILGLYRFCKDADGEKDISGFNSLLWNYTSLPVVMTGLSVVIFSRTKVKLWLVFLIAIACNLSLAIVTSLAIGLTYGRGLWVESGIFLLFIGVPFWALHPKLIAYLGLLSTTTRFAGPVLGAVSPMAYFPFCQLRGWWFSGPLLALMVVNMFLAWYALLLKPRQERPGEIEELQEIP